MVSIAPTESMVLDTLEARWASEGYRLIRQPHPNELPAFLKGFQPDAIALGPEPSLVIEVLRSRSRSTDTKVKQLQSLLAEHPDWRLEVIYASPEGVPLAAATDHDVQAALDEAKHVAEIAPRPALLLTWSIFEAVGRRLEPGLAARSLTPGSLIDVMISTGRLPQADSHFLRQMAQARNAVAHGLLDLRPSRGDVLRLIEICDRLNQEPMAVPS